MAKKQKREIVHFACLQSEFEKMQGYLADDKPVFLTFLDIMNYKDSKHDHKVFIKMAIEKAED